MFVDFFWVNIFRMARKVEITSMSKSRRKALYDDLEEEAVWLGHPFAKGEIVWLICRALYDNMHAPHNDINSKVCRLLLAANDLVVFTSGMYPDNVAEGPNIEKFWKCSAASAKTYVY